MGILALIFITFYFFIGTLVFIHKSKMHWASLREKYPCTLNEFKEISGDSTSRFVYAINGTWFSTNYISVELGNGFLYLCGDNYYTFWGWLNPPIKLPLDEFSYTGEKRYWFFKRDVVEFVIDNLSLSYALPKELSIKHALEQQST